MYHAADLRGVGCQTGYACVHKLTNSAGLFSGLLCLLLSRLHSLQRSFDGNQAFAQNADSIEKTIEAVFVNRGWFSHNACHHINPEEGKLARCNTRLDSTTMVWPIMWRYFSVARPCLSDGWVSKTMKNTKFVVKVNRASNRATEYVQRIDLTPTPVLTVSGARLAVSPERKTSLFLPPLTFKVRGVIRIAAAFVLRCLRIGAQRPRHLCVRSVLAFELRRNNC